MEAETTARPVQRLEDTGRDGDWNDFIRDQPAGSAFQLAGWRHALATAYGIRAFFLYLQNDNGEITATLPLALTGNRLLGRKLTSLPFLDYAGLSAHSDVDITPLVDAASELAAQHGCKTLDIRCATDTPQPAEVVSTSHAKVRPVKSIDLPAADMLKGFKAKLRAQIKRPMKAGLSHRDGGAELLDDFYAVFLENMRDLGSPVHSREFFAAILATLGDSARVFIVYQDNIPLAASILLTTPALAENPWASSVRRASKLSPNMLLYWAMLEYCANHHIETFSFGRSSPDSGTWRFKQQWGVTDHPLHWYRLRGARYDDNDDGGRGKLAETAINTWQRLPVPVTAMLGPRIRRYITL